MAVEIGSRPRLLTVEQARERLQVGRSTMYDLVAEKVVPSVRIGRSVRIPEDQLEAWIVAQQSA